MEWGWSAELPRVGDSACGGVIRREPEDFVVEEVPAYEPEGSGEHVYVKLRKRGHNTGYVAKALARCFGVRPRDVGYAGRKDRWAVTTQWMSVYWPGQEGEEAACARLELEGVEVLEVTRHGNKLRRGHLKGNRFAIRVREMTRVDEASIQATCARLRARGCYNYYGAQRFGRDGQTLAEGLELLRGWGGGRRRLRRRQLLAVNAVQSAGFNHYIALREAEGPGAWGVLEGDVLRKVGGGLFMCEEPGVDAARAEQGEIVVTGPMAGSQMMRPTGPSEALESKVIASLPGALMSERIRGAEGSRRELVVRVDDLSAEVSAEARAMTLRFALPSGSYATVICRELMGDEDEPA